MQYGPYITTYRKHRRRGGSLGVWLTTAVVVAALIAGAAVFVRARSGAAASVVTAARIPSAEVRSELVSPPAPVVTQGETETVRPTPASTATKTDSAGEASENESGSRDAVAEAALDFPGPPSIQPQSIASLEPKHKYVAITLDDGYGFEPRLLTLFEKYDARCTVFVLGEWALDNKKTLRKLDKAGFEIANHGWDHEDLTQLSDAQIRSQLRRAQKVISAVTGNQAPYMRPPYGATNSRVKRVAGELGYKVIMWNRSFADTSAKASSERSYRSVMERSGGIRPGDIIVGHIGSDDTYGALERILPELKAQGYEFVTVSELIADSQGNE